MTNEIRVLATVLPGGKVEIISPRLPVGQPVEVIIRVPDPAGPSAPSVLEWLRFLPPSSRTPDEWAERDRQFQSERDSWDR